MRMPRDLSGADLVKKLKFLGYSVTRQSGSHIRLSTIMGGQHHVTIPEHDPLKVGTLSGILTDVATHHKMTKDELIKKLG